MSQMESLRQILYKAIENGNNTEILKVSQELDEVILSYMRYHLNPNIKS